MQIFLKTRWWRCEFRRCISRCEVHKTPRSHCVRIPAAEYDAHVQYTVLSEYCFGLVSGVAYSSGTYPVLTHLLIGFAACSWQRIIVQSQPRAQPVLSRR